MPNYLLLAAESALAVFGMRSVYEQPRYEVLATLASSVEIRRYAPRLAAEVTVEAASEEAGRSAAFGILAGYIFGRNREKAEIAMTTPVATAPAGRAIAMTAPVATGSAGPGNWTQRFFLPKTVTRASAPLPDDPRVRIVEMPEETVAAITFGGSARAETVSAKTRALLDVLAGSAWQPAGSPVTMFYDPPFTIPPLRRNEVAVPVAGAG